MAAKSVRTEPVEVRYLEETHFDKLSASGLSRPARFKMRHYRNDTEADRLILMCDVKRPLNGLGSLFNGVCRAVTRASVVPNTPEDRRGLVNRVFAGLAPLLARSKA